MSTHYQLGGYTFAKDLVFGWTIAINGSSNIVPFTMLDTKDNSLAIFLDNLSFPAYVPEELKVVVKDYVAKVKATKALKETPVECRPVQTPVYSTGVEEDLGIMIVKKQLKELINSGSCDTKQVQLFSAFLADRAFNLLVVTDSNWQKSVLSSKKYGTVEIQFHGTKENFQMSETSEMVEYVSGLVFPLETSI